MDSGNRRQWPRFAAAGLSGLLRVHGQPQQTRVENLSLGGALLSGSCDPGTNVVLELRTGRRRVLRLVCRVIAVVPKTAARAQCGLRVRFNPASASATAELYALIRRLGGPPPLPVRPPPPPVDDEPDSDVDLEIDEAQRLEALMSGFQSERDEPPITVADLMTELRIEALQRQLARVRRNARRLH